MTRPADPEAAATVVLSIENAMALNEKQKKQLDIARKKLTKLQQLVAASKQQMDDPAEVELLQNQIVDLESQIESIKKDG